MAFITLEDRYAQIEVIVFARQYRELSDILSQEAAVSIKGNVSIEDGETSRIILSSASPLLTNKEYLKKPSDTEESISKSKKRVYIKLKSLKDERVNTIFRIAALNRGDTEVVVYDASTGKYSVLKGALLNPTEKVLERLSSVFSTENVVFR